jgi:hypothetical protein
MRRLTALVIVVAALVAASTALAGGWASVTLEATPTGIGAGDTWNAQLTVLRHGITPTDGAEPSVTIVNEATGAEQTFQAEPTGETGKYAAAVVFPESGEWRYSVNDGLAATGYGISQVSTYPPVTVTGSTGGGASPDVPVAPVLVVLVAALAFCGAIYAFRRQRRLTPASR